MKLQLALDTFCLEEALSLAEKVRDYVDIFEIGTPFIIEEGMHAVRRFREKFPEKVILADTKIMDAGELEAESVFQAGADYATVLAVTDHATLEACQEAAQRYGKKIAADLITVSDIPQKAAELEQIGIAGIAVHTGVDMQRRGRTPLKDLQELKACCRKAEISVAGGISYETLPLYCAQKPDILIVGGAIANASDPVEEAKRIYQQIRQMSEPPVSAKKIEGK